VTRQDREVVYSLHRTSLQYLKDNNNTLLVRIFGMYTIQQHAPMNSDGTPGAPPPPVHVLVMENLLPSIASPVRN